MNTQMTVTESRDVAPQWVGGKGGNLGDFTLPAIGFTGAGLKATVNDPAQGDAFANAFADVLNNQAHIMLGSKLCREAVLPGLDKQGDDEKWEAYAARTYDKAKEIAKAKLPAITLDYVSALKKWALEVFPKRSQRADKRPELGDYDKIVAGVETHWATMSEDKRKTLVTRLALAEEVAAGEAADVKAAIDAKYRRPTATVKADELFS